tara:strand:+ start:3774 stop:5177 length:1404 start_codon:yes stop_codon:yes gene_type:complete
MKLAAIYNVFDAEELLTHSIRSIKEVVDVIIIVYQNVSNYGELHTNPDFEEWLRELNTDIIIKYKPKIINSPLNGEINERTKRALGARQALDAGCTHYLFVDCDEFYDKNQFARAKEVIIVNDYDSSACLLSTYYKKATYKLVPNEAYYVPFICKLQKGVTKFANHPDYPVAADPSRKSSPFDNFKKFAREDLVMHHYTMVRANIITKFKNHSGLKKINFNYDKILEDFNNFEPGDKMIYPFEKYSIEIVENYFNIPDEFGETQNNSYWRQFYSEKKENIKMEPTKFAVFSYNYIKTHFKKNFNNLRMVDIGCGNGRDIFFFRENGIEATGVDANFSHESEHVLKEDVLEMLDREKDHDIYYARFFLHTIPESKLDNLLLKISQQMSTNSIFLFETRSSRDYGNADKRVTNFRGPVGDKHARILYSRTYLENKMSNNFRVLYVDENVGLAPYKTEDPTVIRMILEKK